MQQSNTPNTPNTNQYVRPAHIPPHIQLVHWPKYFDWPSVAALRDLVFHAQRRNFEHVISRPMGRILIDVEQFFEWQKNNQYQRRSRVTSK
ncbi:hypothetical protein [Deefgea salmonis]|uniref:Uncharacterized protein n=1 Tax=Deefgea salmonis TaxID=2875502 RepID=A0ABS8BIZ0_9NEIS|nr:hypothetical protein [Deefgea salmonis]MCB5195687.1 hypothetical protein [Deefgea salmonis]